LIFTACVRDSRSFKIADPGQHNAHPDHQEKKRTKNFKTAMCKQSSFDIEIAPAGAKSPMPSRHLNGDPCSDIGFATLQSCVSSRLVAELLPELLTSTG
jgi:hypothetical protein